MRFASVMHDGQPHAVAIDDATAIPLTDIAELGTDTPNEVLRDPPLNRSAAFALSDATLRPLVPRPGKVICVGLNYKAHIEETQRDDSDYPVLFTKFATSLTGAYDPILCPPESKQVDYEGELAVVIGALARRVAPARALDVVAGYTVANDVTMRDETDPEPALDAVDEIPDPRHAHRRADGFAAVARSMVPNTIQTAVRTALAPRSTALTSNLPMPRLAPRRGRCRRQRPHTREARTP